MPRWAVLALGTLAACIAERDRPTAGQDVGDLADIVIVSPTTGASVIVPGPLPVRIDVSSTSGLLESVGVTARLNNGDAVGDTAVPFDPTVGDTALTLTLVLGGLQSSTQLNLEARARVLGQTGTSEVVPVVTVHCDDLPPGSCP